jgi:hypothetical protein
MAVGGELFGGDVAEAGAVAGVPVDLERGVRDAGEEGGEVGGIEVGFEVELDVVGDGDGQGG